MPMTEKEGTASTALLSETGKSKEKLKMKGIAGEKSGQQQQKDAKNSGMEKIICV
jgi:hypothetical protein